MKSNIRFAYLRNSKGVPYACVAYEYAKGAKEVGTAYGVSVLNVRDGDRWDRKMARLIAAGHLAVDETFARIDRSVETNGELLELVMEDIVNNSKMPSRARRGAKSWLQERAHSVAPRTERVAAPVSYLHVDTSDVAF